MSDWNRPWVIDREAYHERTAIIWEGNPGMTELRAYELASDSGYQTLLSKVATEAIRGNWEPAEELCQAERRKHGEDYAVLLMSAINEAIAEKRALMS